MSKIARFKVTGRKDQEWVTLTIKADNEQAALSKARDTYKLEDLHIPNSAFDTAWTRRSYPYVKQARGKSQPVKIYN